MTPGCTIHYEDGLKFIRSREDEYDLIIVDSTDPFGPGEGLFTREFYGNCYKALKEDGIMVNQHESPFYDEDAAACQRAHKRIVESFPISKVYQAHIPTYPSGHWLFGFASKKYHPLKDLDETRLEHAGHPLPVLHHHAAQGRVLHCPAYVEELLKHVEIKILKPSSAATTSGRRRAPSCLARPLIPPPPTGRAPGLAAAPSGGSPTALRATVPTRTRTWRTSPCSTAATSSCRLGDAALALAQIEERAAAILEAGKRPFLLGGEHLVTLGAFRAACRQVPGYPHPPL